MLNIIVTTSKMKLILWIASFLVSISFSFSGDILVTAPRKRLTRSIEKTLPGMGMRQCVKNCEIYGPCKAVNYNRNELTCQFLRDATTDTTELVDDEQSSYIDIQQQTTVCNVLLHIHKYCHIIDHINESFPELVAAKTLWLGKPVIVNVFLKFNFRNYRHATQLVKTDDVWNCRLERTIATVSKDSYISGTFIENLVLIECTSNYLNLNFFLEN